LMVTERQTSVHFSRWIAGRLEQLWRTAGEAEREQFDEQIRTLTEQTLAADPAERQWWSQVVAFHPAGAELTRSLIDDALRNDRLTRAETLLLQLLESGPDEALRFWALERLVRFFREHDRHRDALAVLEQYAGGIVGGDALRATMLEPL